MRQKRRGFLNKANDVSQHLSPHTRDTHTHRERKTKETQSPILIQNKKKTNNTHTKK